MSNSCVIPRPPGNCAECPKLVCTRKQVVQSRGPDDAEVIVVGQAPGCQEDKVGRPFVGPSGKLVEILLSKVAEINVDCVRFTNVVRCYPGRDEQNGRDRKPSSEERKTCATKWLMPELNGLKHVKLVITLGDDALKALVKGGTLESVHGTEIDQSEASYKVFPTYHPSAPAAPGKFNVINKIIEDFARLKGISYLSPSNRSRVAVSSALPVTTGAVTCAARSAHS